MTSLYLLSQQTMRNAPLPIFRCADIGVLQPSPFRMSVVPFAAVEPSLRWDYAFHQTGLAISMLG
jgi:hypothetical protein